MKKDLKGVIFDLDGTLLDSMNVWERIDEEFLGSRGFEVPSDYIEVITPLGFRETARYTIKRFGLDEKEDDIIAEWTQMAIEAYGHRVELKPNAKKFLISLRERGIKLAIATATMPELCYAALKNNGIEDFFDNITFINEAGRGKGFPDVYLLAAERMGVNPYECVVFEDIPAGISGANMGGFYTVGVYEKTSAHLEKQMREIADEFIYEFPAS